VKHAFWLGYALLAGGLAACQQTWVLDSLGPDGGHPGTGGASGSGGGKGGYSPSDASTDGHCFGNGPQIPYTPDVPQILVALDRSSSMGASFGNTDQLHAALNAIQADVSKYGGMHNSRPFVQFYFLDFPDTSPSCSAVTGCCSSDPTTNYNDFQNAGTCNSSGPDCIQSMNRPTAAALYRAYQYFFSGSSTQHGNERFVLLVTDDDPSGSCPSSNSACTDAENNVFELSGIGVTTEVVAIGGGAPCLNELATVTGVSPLPYYPAYGPNDLPNAIDGVVSTVAQNSCRLTLSSQPSSSGLTVYFGGVKQTQDPGMTGNGFFYDGNNRIILHGSLCQNFLSTSPSSSFGLQIVDSCGSDHSSGNP
jgi:hypothetical protein